MATILTKAIITSALQEVDSYITTANSLYQELQGVISALTTANFNGDASDGYKVFFDSKVTPALTENLTAPNSSLTAGIKSILETIQSQLLDTVDPELGNTNRDPGQSMAQAAIGAAAVIGNGINAVGPDIAVPIMAEIG